MLPWCSWVLRAGLEPARPFDHCVLNAAWLPLHHLSGLATHRLPASKQPSLLGESSSQTTCAGFRSSTQSTGAASPRRTQPENRRAHSCRTNPTDESACVLGSYAARTDTDETIFLLPSCISIPPRRREALGWVMKMRSRSMALRDGNDRFPGALVVRARTFADDSTSLIRGVAPNLVLGPIFFACRTEFKVWLRLPSPGLAGCFSLRDGGLPVVRQTAERHLPYPEVDEHRYFSTLVHFP